MHSCWSLREGASQPGELLARARELGYDTLALTDHDGLYGSMEFAQKAHEAGIRPITGAELTMSDGSHLTVLAETVDGYRNISRLLSLAHEPDRENPRTDRETFFAHSKGLIVLSGCHEGEIPRLLDSGETGAAAAVARDYADRLGPGQFFLELHHHGIYGDTTRIRALRELSQRTGIPPVATNNVHYHVRERHRLHDVLVAIRHRRTLDSSHELRRANSEFYLKSPEAMAHRFASYHEAIANTRHIAERCIFDLTRDLPYSLPSFPVPANTTMNGHLRDICEVAFTDKFGRVPDEYRNEARQRLERELMLIEKHGLAGFFLVYWELLRLAGEIAYELHGRSLRLRPDERPVARGRGSSVASIVCYLIGLSHIDPVKNELFLDRFLNEELHFLPDIDLDFPRDIRDELLKRIPDHFGPGHAALVAAFPTYRFRNAVRDIGKVLGLPEPLLSRLSKLGGSMYAGSEAIAEGMRHIPELQAFASAPGWRHLIELASQLEGFPRHLSQHSGGVVIASEPLSSIVPIVPARMEGRVICQWDKDSVDDARMVKIDFLALGMLSAVDECLEMIEETHGKRPDLGRIPHDDPEIFATIREGDTIGLFQIESRAQIQSLPRTQPTTLDDLATQVAIIRPGPIMAGAFIPYMERKARRARGEDTIPIDYGHPELEKPLKDILSPTLGHVLYQDQVLQIAVEVAGFSPGEADALRRALSRKRDDAEAMKEPARNFARKAQARGFSEAAISAAWERMSAFRSFGFPKSHAVAFALLAYESAWLRHHYPAHYYAALINAQPMGFYSVETLCNDARQHGLTVELPEVNSSQEGAWPTDDGFQLGLRQVARLGGDWRTRAGSTAARIAHEREREGPFMSLRDLVTRTNLKHDEAEALIRAGALRSFGLEPRELLWQLGLLVPRAGIQAPLALPVEQDMVELPSLNSWEQELWDFETMGLSTTHPMTLVRPLLNESILTSRHVGGPRNPNRMPHGMRVRVAGMVVCRQRPVTASGLMFLSLEDEWGMTNAVVFKSLQDRYREMVFATPFLVVEGRIDNEKSGFPHIIAERFYRCPTPSPQTPTPRSHDFA